MICTWYQDSLIGKTKLLCPEPVTTLIITGCLNQHITVEHFCQEHTSKWMQIYQINDAACIHGCELSIDSYIEHFI